MSAPVDRVLSALREHGLEPKRAGAGWCCRCPAHDDRNPSLSIHAGDDGRALVNCHAGCTVDAVCGAIGLRPADLFTADPSRRNGHAPKTRRRGDGDETTRKPARGGGSVTVASDATGGRTFPTARDAVAELERRHGPRSTTWTYHDAGGDPVGLVVRWDTPVGKDVRPVSKTPAGWIIGGMPTAGGGRPLYGLPDLLATKPGDRVYVCEGEPATTAARVVGLTATTSPHGSKSAGKADWSPLSGRDVVILPDHDDAGERYADDAARLATAAGAKSVKVVRLVELWAGMPEGGDMADYLDKRRAEGATDDAIRAEIETLVDKTEPETVDPPTPARRPFPVTALPAVIRDHAAAVAHAMDAPCPSMVALPALCASAACIGASLSVLVRRGWIEPAVLWCGVIAEPGSLKTQAIRAALAPLFDVQAELDAEHEAAEAEYQEQLAAHKAATEEAKRAKRPAPAEAPKPPARRQAVVGNATPEALAHVLGANPRGVLACFDELAALFGSFGQYSKARHGAEPGAAFYKSSFSGESYIENRKGDDGRGRYLHIPRPLLSVCGGIQPGALRGVIDAQRVADGLASRFVWTMPPDHAGRWVPENQSADARAEAAATRYAVALRYLRCIPLDTEPLTGRVRPRVVGLSREAQRVAADFVNEWAEMIAAEDDPAARAALAKLKGVTFRIALVFEILNAIADGPLERLPTIRAATIRDAVTMTRWLADEARRVYAILSESDDDRETRRLVEWIDRKGGTATVRDLTRGPREYRGDPERAAKALGELVAAGVAVWVHDDHGPKGGRPTDRIRLVSRRGDTGDGDETPVNPGNRAGSVTVATVAKPTDTGDWGEL